MKYHDLLLDPSFFESLLQIDEAIADEAAEQACSHCGGPLHRADFQRSGHGLPFGCSAECLIRYSFCCGRDGCRKRHTPQSVRFLRRRVYVAAAFILLSALRHGSDRADLRRLRDRIGVRRQTLDRWIRWWRKEFPVSRFWQAWRGRHPNVESKRLPASLLEAFTCDAFNKEVAISLLRFLAPFTG